MIYYVAVGSKLGRICVAEMLHESIKHNKHFDTTCLPDVIKMFSA